MYIFVCTCVVIIPRVAMDVKLVFEGNFAKPVIYGKIASPLPNTHQ